MGIPTKVIVFGATGATGSYAALQAHQEGAQVTLAVRDPSKPIPLLDGIPAEKVQADLTKPETLTDAVQQTGATAAYIYVIFDTHDHMRASLVALKEAGITSIVLLSSFSVQGDPASIPADDFIPYEHAQVEISLEEVFGIDNFVSIRPAFFASNILWFKAGIAAGKVKHANFDALADYISPEDIGRVAGSILVNGSSEHVVSLAGLDELTLSEALALVANVLGKEIKTTWVSAQEMKVDRMEQGVEEPLAQWLVTDVTEHAGAFFTFPTYSEAMGNIKKYIKRDPIRFHQWLEENKDKF
ncbi:uncharacterized protein N7483_008339 [Penicillium malachiteum]|uniref:uncharacterized protein n=1 Tax=Penicillium malachiteum TaxID=1324776 RepID=UPI002548BD66|nr:uncharacterized protein N7483_008339 [Penicillium malachiteum]KAJ5720405.1 hypothetical protein N7483_008339 [Penicillium malachiteum]